jgi:predicted nucleic acid-binding protein
MVTAFWDSSAIVPLCLEQPSTPAARALTAQFGLVVWWAAAVEVRSAIARLMRMRQISSRGQVQAILLLDQLRTDWREIRPMDHVRERAEQLLDRSPLHAADALQLAASWIWCQGHPRNRRFISGDVQLLDAARKLGFTPLPVTVKEI